MAYGTVNADVISTSVANTSLGAGNATRFKNRIINGDMRIDQRNAGASITPTANTYCADRWRAIADASSKYSIQQVTDAPTGFSNSLKMTSLSAYSAGATEIFGVWQPIEGFNTADLSFGTANAKTVTLSFWVKSSLTGTFSGSLQNADYTRGYPFTYTISSSNTWEQKSVTIAGDITGTWVGSTNGTGLIVYFSIGAGSSRSNTANAWTGTQYSFAATGATSVVGTNGATFYITGVQLEVGSSATGFEYMDYGRQLAQCQRYFEVQNIAQNYNAGFSTTYAFQSFNFSTTKRTAPTMTFASMVYYSAGSTASFTANISTSNTTQYSVGSNAFTSFNGIQGGTISASAEL